MRQKRLAVFLSLVLALVGCSPPISTNSDDYVGEYVFKPANADPGQFADFVILKKDHSALEIRFSKDTGQILTTEKQWHLYQGFNEQVVISDFGHPVERTGTVIKLGINGDLDQYYEKVR